MFEIEQSFDELIAAVDRGESLPVSWYTDPAFTELELQKIFRNTWQYVGPLRELVNVGDFISGFAGNVPVAVVRMMVHRDATVLRATAPPEQVPRSGV